MGRSSRHIGRTARDATASSVSRNVRPAFYGELVQFAKVVPWETGMPVPHTATT